MLEKAERMADGDPDKPEDTATAHWLRGRWKCPRARFPERDDPSHLEPDCRDTIARVEQLTGATNLCTCPLYYTRLPWVIAVSELRAYRDKNMLPMVRTHLDSIEVDAMLAIDIARGERDMHEADEMKREQELAARHAAVAAKHRPIP